MKTTNQVERATVPADRNQPDLRALAALPSLGMTSAEMLVDAGIADPEQLKRVGVEEAYRRLRFTHGKRATTNFIYALECAFTGSRWSDLSTRRKARLKTAAEAIQAQIAARRRT